LEVGNNFVVNVEEGNSKGLEVWILCCNKPLHKLNGPLNCKWGMNYNERDEVVEGKYYKKFIFNLCIAERFPCGILIFTFG
jgi:hypothetical protein